MNEQFTVVAHLVANEDKIEEAKTFLLSLIPPSLAEPGCIEYLLHQDNENPTEFTFYENWTTREEWEKHNERPHIREVAKHKGELFALEPKIRQMTMVGGR